MNCRRLFIVEFIFISLLVSVHVNGASTPQDDDVLFHDNYASLWGGDHVKLLRHHREVQLTLDQYSGSGFQSLEKYGSGFFNMRIKIPQKDSTAIITTFYLQSDTKEHRDEIDFEFLGGNKKEQPYLLHTNIFVNGQGGREQRILLWFDPSADFHNYSLLWNHRQLAFFVDKVPIRVMKNTREYGGSYPTHAMRIIGTIWTHPWASHGRPVKWSDAPFQARYRGFEVNACQTQNDINDHPCHSSKFWWNQEKYWTLNSAQLAEYRLVRNKYLNYDYCSVTHNPECLYL